MSTAETDRPYRELGHLLAGLAQKHNAHDHHAIAGHLQRTTRYEVSSQMIVEYFYGARLPEPEFFPAFAEAFSLTVEERRDLAWLYCYGYVPS